MSNANSTSSSSQNVRPSLHCVLLCSGLLLLGIGTLIVLNGSGRGLRGVKSGEGKSEVLLFNSPEVAVGGSFEKPSALTLDAVALQFPSAADVSFSWKVKDAPSRIDGWMSEADDGIQRTIVDPPLRYLKTEQFFSKYGLTNILMCIAAMMAYAGLDERAVVFPAKSPVDAEVLLDMNATQQLLLSANVVLWPRGRVAERGVKARRLHLGLGNRMAIGSSHLPTARSALGYMLAVMAATRQHRVLIQRDFFLSFPFLATQPFDLCFYLRRIVFARAIREKAKAVFRSLHEYHNVNRLLALHLRLESDVKWLVAKAGEITADELKRFFLEEIIPLAKKHNIDAIYVCSGKLDPRYDVVFHNLPMKVLRKRNFSDELKEDVANEGSKTSVVSNHFAAALELTILQHSTIAVGCQVSTMSVAILAKRCPSPAVNATFDHFQNSTLVKWVGVNNGSSVRSSVLVADQRPMQAPGMYTYTFAVDEAPPRFSKLMYHVCDRPMRGQCFYHGSRRQ